VLGADQRARGGVDIRASSFDEKYLDLERKRLEFKSLDVKILLVEDSVHGRHS